MSVVYAEEGKVYYENGVALGELAMGVDGYYVFFPEKRGGYWDAPVLLALSELLTEMNAAWDAQVQKALSK